VEFRRRGAADARGRGASRAPIGVCEWSSALAVAYGESHLPVGRTRSMARSTSRIGSAFSFAMAFVAAISLAAPALACWDGMAAAGQRVDVSVWRDASWRPETAQSMATWITRLDALIPEGTTVTILNQSIMCDGPACPESVFGLEEPVSGDMPSAFAVTAKMLKVSPAVRARAASLTSSVYTVQVYAGAKKGALAEREHIHALADELEVGLSGFYVEGGFPAIHPVAHIVREGDTYRVVVGAHRTIANARIAVDALSAKGVKGVKGFVRTMPPGTTFDEPVSSSGGEG